VGIWSRRRGRDRNRRFRAGTGATPKVIRDNVGIPIELALGVSISDYAKKV